MERSTPYSFDRYWRKDPDRSRHEQWRGTSPTTQPTPDSIEVDSGGDAYWQMVRWEPAGKLAQRDRREQADKADDSKRGKLGMVSIEWAALTRITSQEVHKTGESQINGAPVYIFEMPEVAYFRALWEVSGTKPSARDERYLPKGNIRIYVSKESGMPIRYEEFDPIEAGGKVHHGDVKWDVPMNDELFQPPQFDDSWTVMDYRTVEFQGRALKSGITLRISPPAGAPVLTERDVAGMSVIEITGTSRVVPARNVWFGLTEKAEQRLTAYSETHVGQTLTITFAGQALAWERGGSTVNRPTELKVWKGLTSIPGGNITDLCASAAAFERDFLAPAPASRPADSAPTSSATR